MPEINSARGWFPAARLPPLAPLSYSPPALPPDGGGGVQPHLYVHPHSSLPPCTTSSPLNPLDGGRRVQPRNALGKIPQLGRLKGGVVAAQAVRVDKRLGRGEWGREACDPHSLGREGFTDLDC